MEEQIGYFPRRPWASHGRPGNLGTLLDARDVRSTATRFWASRGAAGVARAPGHFSGCCRTLRAPRGGSGARGHFSGRFERYGALCGATGRCGGTSGASGRLGHFGGVSGRVSGSSRALPGAFRGRGGTRPEAPPDIPVPEALRSTALVPVTPEAPRSAPKCPGRPRRPKHQEATHGASKRLEETERCSETPRSARSAAFTIIQNREHDWSAHPSPPYKFHVEFYEKIRA